MCPMFFFNCFIRTPSRSSVILVVLVLAPNLAAELLLAVAVVLPLVLVVVALLVVAVVLLLVLPLALPLVLALFLSLLVEREPEEAKLLNAMTVVLEDAAIPSPEAALVVPPSLWMILLQDPLVAKEGKVYMIDIVHLLNTHMCLSAHDDE